MKPILIIIVGLLLASLACTLTNSLTATPAPTPKDDPAGSGLNKMSLSFAPSATSAITSQSLIATTPETPSVLHPTLAICFPGNYAGQVHVRSCGDISCRVLGMLSAGEQVQVVEVAVETQGRWARIIAPIEGWLNARYICEDVP